MENTGTQYIDTIYKHNQNTRFVSRVSIQQHRDWTAIFGSWGNTSPSQSVLGMETSDSTLGIALYYSNVSNVFNYSMSNLGSILQVDINKNSITVNGTTSSYSQSVFQSIYNDTLFGVTHYDGSVLRCVSIIRIYDFQIYENDVLVRDFIPVRRGNIGYMYDRVSGKLFGNKGTGNFILGADVANPIPNIRRVFRFGNKRFVMPIILGQDIND